MTGRDLILYILENHLEDEPVFKNGKIMGFKTVVEMAEKFDVGTATVIAWLDQYKVDIMVISNQIYIPATFVPECKKSKE